MDARELTKALGGRWAGSSGSARCPAHPDKDPSLSVSDGDDGKLLVKCHSGCDQTAVVGALKARGLWPNGGGNGRTISATYGYDDEDGTLLYQVVRTIPKDFRQRRPDGEGGWLWKVKGVPKVPYRLFKLQAKVAHNTVLIVEGEKDVDRLADLGFVATCNAGGAGKWTDELNEHFRDMTVYLLPDNDDTGRAHAQDVASKLAPLAREVRVVELSDLPEKGDVSDWLDSGGDHTKLIDICKAAPIWAREKVSRPRLGLIPFADIRCSEEPSYLVKGLIPREGLTVVWGPPKCGKSFWTFDLTMHVALNWSYRGRRVVNGPVVYVACEGAHGFRARIEAYRQQHLQNHVADVPFFLVPARFSLVEDHEALITGISIALGETKPAVVVIDTLNRSLTGSENSDQDMSNYVKAADAIHETFACAVLVVHHCGVEGTRPRGHTSLSGAVEAQIAIKRDTDGGTATAKVEYMKDGPEGDEISFRLEQVELGSDEDGEAITSCVVVEADAPVAKSATHPKLGKNEQSMFDILADHMPDGLTKHEWNELARDDGIGVKRRADLADCRRRLNRKKLIHETQGRWYVTSKTN